VAQATPPSIQRSWGGEPIEPHADGRSATSTTRIAADALVLRPIDGTVDETDSTLAR
jgi:hypothetical protein